MSYRALLVHRCDLYDLRTTDNDGSPVTTYQKVNAAPIRCRLDLNFIRQAKDPMWTATIATPEDRFGVMFFMPEEKIQAGMRVVMLKGPGGTFQLKGAIDEAWDSNSLDHLEVGVAEVSTLQWRAPVSQTPGDNFG